MRLRLVSERKSVRLRQRYSGDVASDRRKLRNHRFVGNLKYGTEL